MSISERHVLLVTPGFPADEADDSCIPPLQVLLRALSQRHPELRISVLAINYPRRRDPYTWHGIEVIPLGGDNRPLPLRLPALLRGLAAASRLHREQEVDLVHSLWLSDAALLGRLIARQLGLPMAATLMGQDALRSNRYLRWLPMASMRLSAVSQRAADVFKESTGLVVESVLPWGIESSTTEPLPWSERSIDVLGVGSLTRNKDFVTFVRVVERLRDQGRRIRGAIIGDGPQRDSVSTELRNRGLAEVVELWGAQSRADVLETMRNSRILLHPAHYESFGYVFLEALASGMALVSQSVGIAEAGPMWRVCDHGEDMVRACCEILDQPGDGQPSVPYALDDAVDRWAAVYNLRA